MKNKSQITMMVMFLSIFTAQFAMAADVQADQSALTPVTFFLASTPDVVATGAIDARGTYDMFIRGAGNFMAIHCATVLHFTAGDITLRLDCEFANNDGVWRVLSGTGEYAHLKGNGSLHMTDCCEYLTGNIHN